MYYLDHAAATPMSQKALAAMRPYLCDNFFNPSAAYMPAVQVRRDYERAKNEIAHVIGAKGADLVMTSGATEATNLAFTAVNGQGKALISAIEHPSVRENLRRFSSSDEIAVDQNGRLSLEDLRQKLTPDVSFISVCLVSSELGTIQPIAEISRLVLEERRRRLLQGETMPLYLHCDASQGLGIIEVKVNRLGVDLLTLNAAKVYGPKGIGALYIGRNVRIQPLTYGGGQEMGLRSGTENVAATIAFAAAISEAEQHLNGEQKRLAKLKQLMTRELSTLPEIRFLGATKGQLANFVPISLPGLDAERLIFALEERGVYLSTGAACAASKGEKSHTLAAIQLDDRAISGSLRITLGRLNNEQNIVEAAKIIREEVLRERRRLGLD